MPTVKHVVQGEDVRLVVLPRYNEAAVAAWRRFVNSDDIFGLDVESTAPPKFDGKHLFGPALALSEWTVPSDVPATYSKRGYRPGEKQAVKVRLIQFGTATEGWVFDADDPDWEPHIAQFLDHASHRFVSHNASFDAVRVLHRYGIRLGTRSIDTLVMAGLVHPGRTAPTRNHEKGLKELCVWHLEDDGLLRAEQALHARFADLYPRATGLPKSFRPGVDPCRNCKEETSKADSARGFGPACYDAAVGFTQAVLEWGFTHLPIDDPVFLSYAGLDAVYVRRLLPLMDNILRKRNMSAIGRDEQRVKRMMVARTVKGMRVDVDWTKDALGKAEAEFEHAAETVRELTGLKSPRSPRLRTQWLPEHGCRTKSLDKLRRPGLLLRFEHDPVVGPVLRAYDTLMTVSNEISNLRITLSNAEGGNGYVHPNINTLQAHTTRQSVSSPAMQTLAKSGDKGTRLRGCYIADDGWCFVGADWDNQETRIAAGLSGDPALNRIVAENLNQHLLTAESVFVGRFVSKEETPTIYTYAKNLDFAQTYGAMPAKIAKMIGVSEAEAKDMWLKWRETYAGYVNWSDAISQKPWIRNPFGLIIPADAYGRSYANSNYMIQSTGRSMLGKALMWLADNGWGSMVWLTIHDEIVLHVPLARAEEAADALSTAMTMHLPQQDWAPIKVDVVIPATGEVIGPRWRGL
jgi:DNA polymerase-1